jgi:hypothetical protein
MTTATGDFAINFAALGNADPYTNSNLTLIDTGWNFKILSSVLRPSSTGSGLFHMRRVRYNGAMNSGVVLKSKVEIGNSASGDYIYTFLLKSDGSGYAVEINTVNVGIKSVATNGTLTGLQGATLSAIASGDVIEIWWDPSNNLVSAYQNGVAIPGTGVGSKLAITDTTWTSGLAPGHGFDDENSSASTIKSWAGDGIATGATASGAGVTDNTSGPAGSAAPVTVKISGYRLITRSGAAQASISGITALIYKAVPSTAVAPDKVITGVSTNGSGTMSDLDISSIQGTNAAVFVVLMKDGAPFKGGVFKVTPTVS